MFVAAPVVVGAGAAPASCSSVAGLPASTSVAEGVGTGVGSTEGVGAVTGTGAIDEPALALGSVVPECGLFTMNTRRPTMPIKRKTPAMAPTMMTALFAPDCCGTGPPNDRGGIEKESCDGRAYGDGM